MSAYSAGYDEPTRPREVYIHEQVRGFLDELGRLEERRIVDRLRWLASPHARRARLDIDALHLATERQFQRLRIGPYRCVFMCDREGVWVVRLFDRRRGYRWLRPILKEEAHAHRIVVRSPENPLEVGA